tara:strand:- start:156 stop:476 length:321 start_codon:yes stop_codon:yes gene_type:complete
MSSFLAKSQRVITAINKGIAGINVGRPPAYKPVPEQRNDNDPDIYSEASGGQDSTNTSPQTPFRPMGGGQGSMKKAGCVSSCVAVKGTDRAGVKYCESMCNKKYGK